MNNTSNEAAHVAMPFYSEEIVVDKEGVGGGVEKG